MDRAVRQAAFVADVIAVDLLGKEAQEGGDFGVGRTARNRRRRVDADAARVEAAALEALRITRIERVIGGRLERSRGARGEFVEVSAALEIGSGRAAGHPGAAEHWRATTEVILAPDDVFARSTA